MIQIDEWTNCYDLGWQNILCPAAFSHPAKFSRGLIFRIVEHALSSGMIQPGGVVLDPFGGIGAGALPCLQYGLHWVGVELESKFVELGRENINLWNDRYAAHFPNWGTAQILQGDSRRLAEVVGRGAGDGGRGTVVVSSPPFADNDPGQQAYKREWLAEQMRNGKVKTTASGDNIGKNWDNKGDYGSTPGQLATLPPGDIQALISSPPFAGNSGGRGEASRNGIDPGLFDRHSGGMKGGTGSDPANLDHLPMGHIDAVIGSPPFSANGNQPASVSQPGGRQGVRAAYRAAGADAEDHYGSAPGQLGAMKPGEISAVIGSPPFADSVGSDDPDKRGGLFRDEKRRNDTNLTGTYGSSDGQLGEMKAGEVSAVVGSPPFENVEGFRDKSFSDQWGPKQLRTAAPSDYGSTDGQIGATQGQTFWEAAALIVQQCALLLPPGAAAIWVVKSYVKNGKIVDFPGQWQQLCEACGFDTVHVHRAMLVKEHAAQKFMLGGIWLTNKVQKKSFFRRLAEKNGAPPIDFETVLCTVKREAA